MTTQFSMTEWVIPALVALTIIVVLGLTVRFAIPRGRKRPVKAKVLARALLPTRLVRSASGRTDIGWFLFGVLFSGSALGWALYSADWFSGHAHTALIALFGARDPAPLPGWAGMAIMTVALYLAYEFAYWLDHYLSHRVPVLWAFHKVHHTAESLSPLTNYRVHPVDSIVFYNIAAAITGLTAAVVRFALGDTIHGLSIGGANLIVYLMTILFTHLQHSHIWISFPGRAGRWLLSPAHHQIHHSVDVIHHDRNFGSTLALFDRLFGTLHIPAAKREKLTFGVEGIGYPEHSARGTILMPFVDAAKHVLSRFGPVRAFQRGRGNPIPAAGR
jgi:sterol desaturase/sphingolipid hydroxylase (fatty acid hydroxylase superfamily)